MIFAILFVIVFLIGFAGYALTKQWIVSVSVPIVLFLMGVFREDSEPGILIFTIAFGLPLVFFAGLLGAYVFQTRFCPLDKDDNQIQEQEPANDQGTEDKT